MFLKNFINLYNLIYLLIFFVFLYLLNKFIITTKIRNKFALLLTLLFIISSVGLYYSLDGLIMMFLVSELSIILIFITMFSQLYNYNKEHSKQSNFLPFVIILALNFKFYHVNLIKYKNFYVNYSVILNDFYYIYNCYFEKQILLTLLTLFAITIYSIFFILLYYNLKKTKFTKNEVKKNLFLLRKQSLTHQVNFNSKIINFHY